MKVNGGVYFHQAGMISLPPTFPGWHVQSSPLYQLMSVGRPRAAVPARSSVNASRGGGAVTLPVSLSPSRSCPAALRPAGSGLRGAIPFSPAPLPLPSRSAPSPLPLRSTPLPLPSRFPPAPLPLSSRFPPRSHAPSPGSEGTMEQAGQGKPVPSCRHLINGWAGGK